MIRGISHAEEPHFILIEYDAPENISFRLNPVLNRLNKSGMENPKPGGRVVSRKCRYCGHHEIGLETDNGDYLCLKPGMNIKII